jgi:hypothetical protein
MAVFGHQKRKHYKGGRRESNESERDGHEFRHGDLRCHVSAAPDYIEEDKDRYIKEFKAGRQMDYSFLFERKNWISGIFNRAISSVPNIFF